LSPLEDHGIVEGGQPSSSSVWSVVLFLGCNVPWGEQTILEFRTVESVWNVDRVAFAMVVLPAPANSALEGYVAGSQPGGLFGHNFGLADK
jgi:hypothetical protein